MKGGAAAKHAQKEAGRSLITTGMTGLSNSDSGPYTGGVRGGSDEPPFFGHLA